MNTRILISLMSAVFLLLFAAGSMGYDQMAGKGGQSEEPQDSYARQLLTPEELDGRVVQTRQGEQIGIVDGVILDHREGRIAYVVVTSGGFWGVGGDKVVIPWKTMDVQQARLEVLNQDQWKRQPGVQPGVQGSLQQEFRDEPVLVLDVDRETLKKAPQGEIQNILDRLQAEQIHRHYGVSPYWEENSRN